MKYLKNFNQLLNETIRSKKFLSFKKKKEILENFIYWSGGFNPTEVHWEKEDDDDEPGIAFFLKDNHHGDVEVEKWFSDLADGDEDAIAEMQQILKELNNYGS